MRCLHVCGVVLCALLLEVAPATPGEEAERSASKTFDVERFYRDVRQLVRRHYPEATAHRLANKIHFEHDTRIFIIHEALMTGEWQDPREERGPKKGGVHCDIQYRPGRYKGQAVVPQTFDKRYFRLLVLAPYSERLDGHLVVHLKLPGNGTPPEGFQKELTALIRGFGTYAR